MGMQIVQIENIDSMNRNITVLIKNWSNNSSLSRPVEVLIDLENTCNIYVSDSQCSNVVLFYSKQTNNPPPKVIAGLTNVIGSTLDTLNSPRGIALDSKKNLYVVDQGNRRIMLWKPNATFGIVIAGQGLLDNGSVSFGNPISIAIDENDSAIYVVDRDNHRIQSFQLNGTQSYNGTIVAGGNGQGSGTDQLSHPLGLWVSKKTGAIYIADTGNHRIQKWKPGETSGVTIAGSPLGEAGTTATRLFSPYRLIINSDETHMYVSDYSNRRIQRFDLI